MTDVSPRRVTRRTALAGAALFGTGIALDRVLKSPNPQEAEPIAAVPFHGSKQAGIATPAPEFLNFAAYDLTAISPVALRQLLGEWTDVAARLTTGETADQPARDLSRPPSDPGEVFGLGPAALTLTFGFGPALFEKRDLGLSSRSSPTLTPLPPFAGEALDSEVSDGDLCIQACAEDPQVAFHAIHVFTRIASGVATLRWSQQGFGRTSSTGRDQQTSRNLMGFKDGTNNVRADDESEMNEFVWVQPGDGPVWMEGGTYMVVRRIQMLLDVWDATSLDGQQRAVGREKVSGAPLGREGEYDPVDLEAKKNGELMIPVDAHIRLASPDLNGGQKILRRGFSYTEPSQAGSGQLDAGLFFISFQRDPQRQFVPIQQRLAAKDALSRHLLHTGTGVFACPPGVQSGGFIGEGLFA